MRETTKVSVDKVFAYIDTYYRVLCPDQEIVLRIDHRSDAMAALFAAKGVDRAAFLTAYNPFGEEQSEEANALAHQQLGEQLRATGMEVIEGLGGADDANWPPEPSYCVLGMNIVPAKTIGAQFKQDAVVFISSNAVPHLLLLR
jgi:hypothetical protein